MRAVTGTRRWTNGTGGSVSGTGQRVPKTHGGSQITPCPPKGKRRPCGLR